MSVGLLLFLIVALLLLVGARVLLRPDPPLPDGPVCGRCGYSTRGWAGEHCPECGTDKTRVPPVESAHGSPRRVGVYFLRSLGLALVLSLAVIVVLWALVSAMSLLVG